MKVVITDFYSPLVLFTVLLRRESNIRPGPVLCQLNYAVKSVRVRDISKLSVVIDGPKMSGNFVHRNRENTLPLARVVHEITRHFWAVYGVVQ